MNAHQYWQLTRLYIDLLKAKIDIVGQVKVDDVVFVQLYDSRTNTEPCIVLSAEPTYTIDASKINRKLRNMMFRYKYGLRYKRLIET
jgi:hypothetical protein